ncbi:SUKH-3 domain-containing protein [Bremerella sp. JC817]|uniref:SUKH-3 domain-containing protein n=1 Tax=Bremerella sp. JC817 TaxID=3231756 RepID=UPI00345ABE87
MQVNWSKVCSSEVISLMREAGWSPGREVSPEQLHKWKVELESDGFTITDNARKVWHELGGLKIHQRTLASGQIIPGLDFDPLWADGEFDRIEYWERKLSTRMTPIGMIGGGMLIMLAEDDTVYMCFGPTLFFCAQSFTEAMDSHLVVDKKPHQWIGDIE